LLPGLSCATNTPTSARKCYCFLQNLAKIEKA
jgi:hypothetical protein